MGRTCGRAPAQRKTVGIEHADQRGQSNVTMRKMLHSRLEMITPCRSSWPVVMAWRSVVRPRLEAQHRAQTRVSIGSQAGKKGFQKKSYLTEKTKLVNPVPQKKGKTSEFRVIFIQVHTDARNSNAKRGTISRSSRIKSVYAKIKMHAIINLHPRTCRHATQWPFKRLVLIGQL